MGDGTTELYTVEGRRLRHRKRFDTAPDGAVVTELAFENVTDEAFEVRVPDGFLSEGFSIGFAELDRPTGEYRIGVNGESVGAYADLDRFTRFSLEGADPTVTAFDDEVAITLGLVSDSASTPGVLAMVNDGDPGRIQLFVDGATFEPGEVRSWIVAHVCHEGGTAAPGEGTELFRELAS